MSDQNVQHTQVEADATRVDRTQEKEVADARTTPNADMSTESLLKMIEEKDKQIAELHEIIKNLSKNA